MKNKGDFSNPVKWWLDDDLIADLDRRAVDLESGKDKGFTVEESKADLMAHLKKNC